MKKFKLLFITLTLILVVGIFCGCGVMVKEDVYVPYPDDYINSTDKIPNDDYVGDTSGSYIDKDGYEEKIIKNANITVYVDSLSTSLDAIRSKINEHKGYIASSREDMNSSGRATVSIKMPATSLDAFLNEIKAEGECTYLNIYTDNVTGSYYDTKARLENAQAQLEQYRLILKKAQNVDEILKVQPMIDEVQERIERYEMQLKVWDSQVSYATVDLNLLESTPERKDDAPVAIMSLKEFLSGIKNGFMAVLSVCVNVLGYITMGAISAAIPAGIIFVIAILIIKSAKKHRARRKSTNNTEE